MNKEIEFSGLSRQLPDLRAYSNSDLMLLKDQISTLTGKLTDINLEEELVNQLLQTKELLKDVYSDESGDSASQKASLINACSAIIRDLAKTQAEIHNAERLKTMEQTLIEVLTKYDEAISREFLELYERRLKVVV